MKKCLALFLALSLLVCVVISAFAETPEEIRLFLTAEYNRLYQIPATGGDAVLLADAETRCMVRDGDTVLASFADGTVCRFDPAGGNPEVLVTLQGNSLYRVYPLTSGFFGVSVTMQEGPKYYYFNAASGIFSQVFADRLLNDFCTYGDVLLFTEYYDRVPHLIAYDFQSAKKLLDMPVPANTAPFSFENDLYLLYSHDGRLDRLELASGKLTPVEILLKETDYDLLYVYNGNYLVRGNYKDDHLYIVREDSRQRIDIADATFPVFTDAFGKYVLFWHSEYLESTNVENTWYSIFHYYIVNMEDGTVTEIPVRGQYGKLFETGDFPVMDSSTARKPVISMIYSFFCESTGAGGTAPLCSTTHYAWLNIADGTADIALLAAPTQEEQDYLAEKGVTVEMKLYGGDGLVFIGNHACEVDNLTLDQIRAIYRGEIKNWSELGGTDNPIRVLYRDDQSGSQRLFERMLWKDEPVPDFEALGFARLDDMSSIVSQCLYDPYTIGYSIMTYLNDVFGNEDLLAFSLAGYSATPENVASKNYPLSTQGYVVIRSDEAEDSPARRLFNWFGSPLSDYILESNGITPLK